MPHHCRWTEYATYGDFLDVPMDTTNKPKKLVDAIHGYHRSFDELLSVLGSRERQLTKLKFLGMISVRHEPRKFPGGPC